MTILYWDEVDKEIWSVEVNSLSICKDKLDNADLLRREKCKQTLAEKYILKELLVERRTIILIILKKFEHSLGSKYFEYTN